MMSDYNEKKLISVLERIARALERIARATERMDRTMDGANDDNESYDTDD